MRIDETAHKWCPFAISAAYKSDHAAGNRDIDDGPADGCHCISVRCMAWVEDVSRVHALDEAGFKLATPITIAYGHCGLANQRKANHET